MSIKFFEVTGAELVDLQGFYHLQHQAAETTRITNNFQSLSSSKGDIKSNGQMFWF